MSQNHPFGQSRLFWGSMLFLCGATLILKQALLCFLFRVSSGLNGRGCQTLCHNWGTQKRPQSTRCVVLLFSVCPTLCRVTDKPERKKQLILGSHSLPISKPAISYLISHVSPTITRLIHHQLPTKLRLIHHQLPTKLNVSHPTEVRVKIGSWTLKRCVVLLRLSKRGSNWKKMHQLLRANQGQKPWCQPAPEDNLLGALVHSQPRLLSGFMGFVGFNEV